MLLVVVDGPNLVNDVGRVFGVGDRSYQPNPAEIARNRQYLHEWFDIDRLVQATLVCDPVGFAGLGAQQGRIGTSDLGIVCVRSRKAIGGETQKEREAPDVGWRVKGEEVDAFWARQGSNPVTSAMLVDVPGEKEVGVDMAMAVHLFETAESWNSAVLFTNDDDFVPAIWALRRRGKRVHSASRTTDRRRPIVQAAQHFFPWSEAFLRADRALFDLLQPGGPLDDWYSNDTVKARAPRVSLVNDTMNIESRHGLDGNHSNLLNERLRSAAPWLHAQDITTNTTSMSVLALAQPRTSGAIETTLATNWVFAGAIRHAERLFADAQWFKASR